MKKSFLLFIVLTLAVSLSAQTQKEVIVTAKAKACFTKLYPTVKEVKWGKESKNEFEAEFKLNGKATSLVVDAEGNLKETETDISKSELPKGVYEFVKKNHKSWAITEAAKIVDAKGIVTFEVQISKDGKNKDLIFTNDGKPVIKKETTEEKEEKGQREDDEENED